MESNEVSIVILNWNASLTTIKCLESLKLLKESTKVGIYIVDNGSSEEELVILQDYVYKNTLYPKFLKLIRSEKNLGFGGGNNLAIRQIILTNTKYIWLLNNDTIVDKQALEKMLQKLVNDSSIGAVGSKLIYMDNYKIQALGGGRINLDFANSSHIIKYSDIVFLDYLTAASLLVRTEILKLLQGFDEEIFLYWEDVELCLRIKQLGWKLAVATDSLVFHEESSSSKKLGAQRQFYFTQGLDVVLRKHTKHKLIYRNSLNLARAVYKSLRGQSIESKVILKYVLGTIKF